MDSAPLASTRWTPTGGRDPHRPISSPSSSITFGPSTMGILHDSLVSFTSALVQSGLVQKSLTFRISVQCVLGNKWYLFHFTLSFFMSWFISSTANRDKAKWKLFFLSNISLFTKKQPDSYFWIITDQNGSSSIIFVVVVLGLFRKFIFSFQFTFLECATATSVQPPRVPCKLREDYFRFDLVIPLQ